jgi:uncharacterized protein (DUF58 family)
MRSWRRAVWIAGWLRTSWPRGTDRRDPFTWAWKAWRERFSPRGKLLAAIWAFALPLAMLTRGQMGGFALAVACALLASSLALTSVPPRGRARATLPAAVREGETVSVPVRIEVAGAALPVGTSAWIFRCGDGLESTGNPAPPHLDGPGRATAMVPLKGLSRGVHRVEGATLLRDDALGLLRSRRLCPESAEVAVLPRRARVGSLEGLLRGPGAADFAAAVAGASSGEEEVVGIRPWRETDGPREMHHRTWARTGRPAAVDRSPPPGRGVALAFSSARAGAFRSALLEPAISLCAGIAAHLADLGTLAEFHLDGIPVPLASSDPMPALERALAGLPPSIDWNRRRKPSAPGELRTALPLLRVGLWDGLPPEDGTPLVRTVWVDWGEGAPPAGTIRVDPRRILSNEVRL